MMEAGGRVYKGRPSHVRACHHFVAQAVPPVALGERARHGLVLQAEPGRKIQDSMLGHQAMECICSSLAKLLEWRNRGDTCRTYDSLVSTLHCVSLLKRHAIRFHHRTSIISVHASIISGSK